MHIDPESSCPTLVCYGFTPPDSAMGRSVYDALVHWSEDIGCSFTRSYIAAEGARKGYVPFSANDRWFKGRASQSFTALELAADDPGGTNLNRDWLVAVHLRLNAFVVSVDSSVVPELDGLRTLAERITRLLRPFYGYGWLCPRRWAPVYHSMGICAGALFPSKNYSSELDEERARTGAWGAIAMQDGVFQSHCLLRDIFRWNFLSPPLRRRPVGGKPFEAWIREDPARGKLTELAHEDALWEVAPEALHKLRMDPALLDVVFNRERYLRALKDESQKSTARN